MEPSEDEIKRQLESLTAFKDMLEKAQEEAKAEDAAALNEQNEGGFQPATKITVASISSAIAPSALVPGPSPPPVAKKPSKDFTGVEPDVTSICATISLQIYEATTIESFDLKDNNGNTVAEVIDFDTHGILNDLVPPFAVAITGDIMILAWRGSHTIMDWASDFSASPVSSSRWSQIAPCVKAHSGYVSLVESDLGTHEKKLIKEIRKRKIKQLVTTGHSLAGGMAQVSHVFLEGQLQKQGSFWNNLRGSQWNTLRGKLTVRSIAFAAPMTIMSTMDRAKPDEPTTTFLKKISEHSCNIVYGPDVVPHAYGDTDYLVKVIEIVVRDVANLLPQWARVLVRFFGISSKIIDTIIKVQKNKGELLKVMQKYNHVGKIIYYADNGCTPVELTDDQFRAYNINIPTKSKTCSFEDQLKEAHNYFPLALAYN